MLASIECQKFRQKRIGFYSGLNVILGDNKATNSIGKSTMLMVIDFAFGGGSLIEHNTDLVSELGHHSYRICFKFGAQEYVFDRSTDQPEFVFPVQAGAEDAGIESAPVPIARYRALLKSWYGVEDEDISFRSLVGLYSRIWGKDNLDVRRPLHFHRAQTARDCLDNLIKTFGLYGPIRDLSDLIEQKEKERSALGAAFRAQLLPKIGKRQRKANEQSIIEIEEEIQSIRQHLSIYAANINQLVDERMLDLKVSRDELLSSRTRYQSRLLRTRKNILENRHIKSRHFSALVDFFPEINVSRLVEVEEFHDGVAKLLRRELKDAEAQLSKQVEELDRQISAIDEQMSQSLSSVAKPVEIINRVQDLSDKWREARRENDYFDRSEAIKEGLSDLVASLRENKGQVLASIQNYINTRLAEIAKITFGEGRKSPTLLLKENSYTYEVFEDTGTGTAYSALVMLDLAIFTSTKLPTISHDSVLFKNVENNAVSKLLGLYLSVNKQSFIAIDEADKYGKGTSELLHQRSVIELSDSSVLYIKDWRSRERQG